MAGGYRTGDRCTSRKKSPMSMPPRSRRGGVATGAARCAGSALALAPESATTTSHTIVRLNIAMHTAILLPAGMRQAIFARLQLSRVSPLRSSQTRVEDGLLLLLPSRIRRRETPRKGSQNTFGRLCQASSFPLQYYVYYRGPKRKPSQISIVVFSLISNFPFWESVLFEDCISSIEWLRLGALLCSYSSLRSRAEPRGPQLLPLHALPSAAARPSSVTSSTRAAVESSRR